MKNTTRIIAFAATVLAVLICFSACGGKTTNEDIYNVGIIQLIQHEALDAATRGFREALTEKLGDKVVFNEQNAQGDPNTCATISNGFDGL